MNMFTSNFDLFTAPRSHLFSTATEARSDWTRCAVCEQPFFGNPMFYSRGRSDAFLKGHVVCRDCAAASLLDEGHTSETVELADYFGDVHSVDVSHVSVRIGDEHRARLNAVAAVVGERTFMPVTTSVVLRHVIELGLAAVEAELGLTTPPRASALASTSTSTAEPNIG